MDLDNPGLLLSSLLIGLLGFSLLVYGKKSGNLRALGIGLAMCVFPYFVHSLALMWGLTAAGIGGLCVRPRGG